MAQKNVWPVVHGGQAGNLDLVFDHDHHIREIHATNPLYNGLARDNFAPGVRVCVCVRCVALGGSFMCVRARACAYVYERCESKIAPKTKIMKTNGGTKNADYILEVHTTKRVSRSFFFFVRLKMPRI